MARRPFLNEGQSLDLSELPLADILRFLSKLEEIQVEGVAGPCWIFNGGYADEGGYGSISIGGKMVGAHRVSFALFKGRIPDRRDVDHGVCHLHGCCNPAHLGLKTRRANSKDGARRQKRPPAPF